MVTFFEKWISHVLIVGEFLKEMTFMHFKALYIGNNSRLTACVLKTYVLHLK
jgi:hypothetical protein